jgi:GNAT-family acetyltransferase (TIGR03103 family)|nr:MULTISPECIES: N-acetylglutaminylglutamine synthetase [unclassified Iodidimonas]
MSDVPDDQKDGPANGDQTGKRRAEPSASPGRKPGSGRPDRQYRLDKMRAQSLKPQRKTMAHDAFIDCGWGRLYFAQTFDRLDDVVEALRQEMPQQRDIAFYLRDPHVALSKAPQELFLDPSHTYRLDLHTYQPAVRRFRGFHIRRLSHRSDIAEINRIYAARNMVQVDPSFFWDRRDSRSLTYYVAQDDESGDLVGTVTGVNHYQVYHDPERGASLWCLAVDPQSPYPGIGEALVRRLAEHFQARGNAYLDLSVMHDNEQAIALYEKLGFQRLPFFALKNKNSINEKLFAGPSFDANFNPYALIIVNEARRRGIHVDVLDAENGYFRLSFGGRSVICRESLTELTSAIAMSRCADKMVTRRLLGAANVRVPAQQQAALNPDRNADFLHEHGAIVVKPRHGEQGRGVSVNITDAAHLEQAVEAARRVDDHVLLEEYFDGIDLRIIVIGFKLVAAAIRRPAAIIGDGSSTIEALIKAQSRRRMAATNGESRIPLDQETERTIRSAGFGLADILPAKKQLFVRKTANLHTGGTLHDVTDRLHPHLCQAAITCAKTIDIPVVGVDMIVKSPSEPDYIVIEANERPGLANHEPQPTAERFIDLLFPHSLPTDLKLSKDIGGGS